MAVDGILTNGVTPILKKLSSVVANEITLVWDFNDELKNLQSTLNMILAVMEDAENKQVSSETVRLWMEELKSIAYKAESILDDYSYEIIGNRTHEGKVRTLSLYFRWRMAHKIKEINEKFNEIAKRKNDLGLQTIDVGSSSSYTMMMNRETYSLVAANWKIVGRETDKSNIINTLLDKESCLVLSVVGMGGMGKTTMAQLVYNDKAITEHFQLKIWICVSDPFDVKKLLKNIVNSVGTGKTYDDVATMDDIVIGLQNALRENKFLLVLDDVWNENFEDWHKLKTPLMVGAKGSKILVTTRSVKVAKLMEDKFPHYELGILNDNDIWSLFREIAFGSATGAVETPKLVEIGKEMVKRCGGLPLAVIFLGSLMRSKKKEEEWKNIRDTKIWHESYEGKNLKHSILPSLRLSYDYLPSHLKQCFSYCCLFPKNWKIQRETLIRLWMAEGFLIESPGVNAMSSMKEIGNEYFNNLLCNFFFLDVKRNKDGDIVTCKMHDLVHDLARSVVGKNECLIVENAHDIDCISETTFHLNLVNVDEGMLSKVLEALKNAKNLRTVLFNYKMSTWFDIVKAINKNKRLRVLDQSWFYGIHHSSSSIGELKHLRYLNLVETPKGIGRLRLLQTLNEFNVGNKTYDQNACGIEELEFLNHLTGDLTINHLENVTSETSACIANLKEKKLRGLKLYWSDLDPCLNENVSWLQKLHWSACSVIDDDDEILKRNNEAVLEGLRPHPNLTTLWINNFKGAKLPRWMQEDDSSSTNCYCLPNLVVLNLSDCKKLVTAVFGTLPSLKKLTLHSLSSLKEWVVPPSALKKLQDIEINYCNRLTTITPTTTIFPSLKVLYLSYIDGRAAKPLVTNNLNSLTHLRLHGIPNLITLPCQGLMENNNTLLSLAISNCPDFKGFLPPNMDEDDDRLQEVSQVRVSPSSSSCCSSCSSFLQFLKLHKCPALRSYPNIHSLTSLRALEIQECKISKSLNDELTLLSSSSSSSSSSLKHLKHVKILKNETVFQILKTATKINFVFRPWSDESEDMNMRDPMYRYPIYDYESEDM